MHKYFIFLCLCYICCVAWEVKAKQKDVKTFREVICKSATIRSIKDFNQLENCTVVAGYVRIVHMQFTPVALQQVKSSHIEEISEYLLVYRVEGLDSLERLFPKLIVIRGIELLYEQYALVVLENRDLQNIGLISLLRVLKGSIRVESNPSLCFTHTINWVAILGNNTKQYYYVMKNNKSPNQCPLCYTYQDELDTVEENRHKECWSLGKYQLSTLDYIGGKKCYKQGGRSNCLTSCSDNNCRHCTNYVSDRGCVDNCLPPKYRLAYKRQCVNDCSQLGLISLGMECVEKCPQHYNEIKQNGKTSCWLNCKGNFVIHEVKDLEGLADCTTIEGSLTIELYDVNKPLIQNLEETFRHLNEITGYLKILNSPQIVSLHFFKSLHTIGGRELIENRYSLYVVNNHYLEELWFSKVAIMHGCVYFHLNPRLCFDKITDLQENFKECKRITVKDASRNSNGERVICGQNVHTFSANITDYNSTAAVIEFDLLGHDEFMILIGYIYYYKEAPERNVTKFAGRHGCGNDDWLTDVVVTKRRRHILKNLKPGTQYAFFVKSMTTMHYSYQGEMITEIGYFQTEPAKPGLVAKIYTHSLSSKEIEVHWWPPRITNGIIEKYILQYEETNETIPSSMMKQNKEQFCQCPKLDIESKIPTPHVDDYYIREQALYKDFLSNFLFQKSTNNQLSERTPSPNETSAEDNKKIKKDIVKDKWEEENMKEKAEQLKNLDKSENHKDKEKSDDQIAKEKSDDLQDKEKYAFTQLDDLDTREQEEGKENYFVSHPYPVCNQTNPNIQDQTENKCIPLERFDDAIEIPCNRHSYILNNLQPEKTYRISLRACVKDLANGCGAAKVILAQTVSKRFETILKSLTFHKL